MWFVKGGRIEAVNAVMLCQYKLKNIYTIKYKDDHGKLKL
jgi:hypothetical protein